MTRPTGWWVLGLDGDPTPGDPLRVQELARWLADIADEADRAGRDVRSLAGDHTTPELDRRGRGRVP